MEPKPSQVEQDFWDAIERILAGSPTDPILRDLATLGKLRLSISTVAKEARRSRRLIGHDGCRYANVRARILGLKAAKSSRNAPVSEIAKLKLMVRELSQQLRHQQHEMYSFVVARQKLEQEVEALKLQRDRARRERDQLKDQCDELIRRIAGDNVVPFKP